MWATGSCFIFLKVVTVAALKCLGPAAPTSFCAAESDQRCSFSVGQGRHNAVHGLLPPAMLHQATAAAVWLWTAVPAPLTPQVVSATGIIQTEQC